MFNGLIYVIHCKNLIQQLKSSYYKAPSYLLLSSVLGHCFVFMSWMSSVCMMSSYLGWLLSHIMWGKTLLVGESLATHKHITHFSYKAVFEVTKPKVALESSVEQTHNSLSKLYLLKPVSYFTPNAFDLLFGKSTE